MGKNKKGANSNNKEVRKAIVKFNEKKNKIAKLLSEIEEKLPSSSIDNKQELQKELVKIQANAAPLTAKSFYDNSLPKSIQNADSQLTEIGSEINNLINAIDNAINKNLKTITVMSEKKEETTEKKIIDKKEVTEKNLDFVKKQDNAEASANDINQTSSDQDNLNQSSISSQNNLGQSSINLDQSGISTDYLKDSLIDLNSSQAENRNQSQLNSQDILGRHLADIDQRNNERNEARDQVSVSGDDQNSASGGDQTSASGGDRASFAPTDADTANLDVNDNTKNLPKLVVQKPAYETSSLRDPNEKVQDNTPANISASFKKQSQLRTSSADASSVRYKRDDRLKLADFDITITEYEVDYNNNTSNIMYKIHHQECYVETGSLCRNTDLDYENFIQVIKYQNKIKAEGIKNSMFNPDKYSLAITNAINDRKEFLWSDPVGIRLVDKVLILEDYLNKDCCATKDKLYYFGINGHIYYKTFLLHYNNIDTSEIFLSTISTKWRKTEEEEDEDDQRFNVKKKFFNIMETHFNYCKEQDKKAKLGHKIFLTKLHEAGFNIKKLLTFNYKLNPAKILEEIIDSITHKDKSQYTNNLLKNLNYDRVYVVQQIKDLYENKGHEQYKEIFQCLTFSHCIAPEATEEEKKILNTIDIDHIYHKYCVNFHKGIEDDGMSDIADLKELEPID